MHERLRAALSSSTYFAVILPRRCGGWGRPVTLVAGFVLASCLMDGPCTNGTLHMMVE